MGYISEPATERQINYIRILFNDVEMGSYIQRKDFLKLRELPTALDELTKQQASEVINELKQIKEAQKAATVETDEDDDIQF